MIICDRRNPRARALLEALSAHLPDGWTPPEGVALVIGGDGFLLRTVAAHGLSQAYLGLNAGHVGFLLNDASDPATIAANLAATNWTERDFPLLEAQVEGTDGPEVTVRAINDIYLERMTGQTVRLRVTIDDYVVVDPLVADGLIFATALGSTAYAYSAGATPIHPTLAVMQVTPICPHRPRLPPFALPPQARAQVEVLDAEWRPVRAVADGRGIDAIRRVHVGFSDQVVRLCYLDDHDFTRQMLRKIVLP